jgi:hypothetical protein
MLFSTIIFLLIVLLFFTIHSSILKTDIIYDRIITSKGNKLILNAKCTQGEICYDKLVATVNPYSMEIIYLDSDYSTDDESIRKGIKEILLKYGAKIDVFNSNMIIKDNKIMFN